MDARDFRGADTSSGVDVGVGATAGLGGGVGGGLVEEFDTLGRRVAVVHGLRHEEERGHHQRYEDQRADAESVLDAELLDDLARDHLALGWDQKLACRSGAVLVWCLRRRMLCGGYVPSRHLL